MLTADEIAALPGMVTEATPGPWRVEQDTTLIWGFCDPDDVSDRGMGYPVAGCRITPVSSWAKGPDENAGEANARLIALTPRLAAAVIEQQAEIERLREALKRCLNFLDIEDTENEFGIALGSGDTARTALGDTQ